MSFNLLSCSHPLRVQKLQLRPPRTWKLEPDEPVTSALRGWISRTPGQWQLRPSSAPSWRPCRARLCERLLGLGSSLTTVQRWLLSLPPVFQLLPSLTSCPQGLS